MIQGVLGRSAPRITPRVRIAAALAAHSPSVRRWVGMAGIDRGRKSVIEFSPLASPMWRDGGSERCIVVVEWSSGGVFSGICKTRRPHRHYKEIRLETAPPSKRLIERRLATVLAADMVEYYAHMGASEETTVHALDEISRVLERHVGEKLEGKVRKLDFP